MLSVFVENLGDNLPLTLNLNQSEEVGVVGTRAVTFHVDADDGGGLSDSKNVVTGLDARGAAIVSNKGVQGVDRPCQHIGFGRVDEAVHHGILVERLSNGIGTSRAQALSVLVGCLNHGIVLAGRNGLDVGSHFLDSKVRESPATLGSRNSGIQMI